MLFRICTAGAAASGAGAAASGAGAAGAAASGAGAGAAASGAFSFFCTELQLFPCGHYRIKSDSIS